MVDHHQLRRRRLPGWRRRDGHPLWLLHRELVEVRGRLKLESVIIRMEESWVLEDVVFNVPGLCSYSIPWVEVRREVSNRGIGGDSPLMEIIPKYFTISLRH